MGIDDETRRVKFMGAPQQKLYGALGASAKMQESIETAGRTRASTIY
jgi:hypothetical protein